MNAVLITILASAVPILLAGAGWLIHQLINTRAQVVILQEEVKQAKETNERQSNDAAILKSVNDTVDNLSDAGVAERLQSDWKSPVK